MKTVLFTLLALVSASAFAAPDKDAVNRNNGRLNQIKNELQGFRLTLDNRTIYKRENADGAKDFAKVAALEKEALDLLALKEDAPDRWSESTIRRAAAVAYSSPIHLRHCADAEREFAAAVKYAKTPDDQALARYEYADFKYREAKDDGKQWIAEKRAAYDLAGVSPWTRFTMIDQGIDGLDPETDGWKVLDGHPELYKDYFESLMRWINYPWNPQLEWFDKRGDVEHLLELAEKAIKVCPENQKWVFVNKRREYLMRLSRAAEVEQDILKSIAAATKLGDRCSLYSALGAHYAARARRYYAPPDETFVKRAFDAYDNALAADPKNGGVALDAIILAMEFKRYDFAKQLLDCYAGEKPDRRFAGFLGDIAYYAGDNATAAKWYLSHPKMDVDRFEREPPTRMDRVVGALYALGRYEEAIEHAKDLAEWMVWKDYRADVIHRIEAKIAEKKGR